MDGRWNGLRDVAGQPVTPTESHSQGYEGGAWADVIFAVHKRHKILRYSWAVEMKLAGSQTTPFVRDTIVLGEDPSSPPLSITTLDGCLGSLNLTLWQG